MTLAGEYRQQAVRNGQPSGLTTHYHISCTPVDWLSEAEHWERATRRSLFAQRLRVGRHLQLKIPSSVDPPRPLDRTALFSHGRRPIDGLL